MQFHPHTLQFTRGKLPHWEVGDGRYFVTVRCADSLPREILGRCAEAAQALQSIAPATPHFGMLQRQYFQLIEKHLDGGLGRCCLRQAPFAEIVVAALRGLADWDVRVPHYSIMPNHWHAVVIPAPGCTRRLRDIVGRVKGSAAFAINRRLGQRGALWQREWFDRWIRSDAEYDRIVAYILNNPVKAGIARAVGEHPFTR